MDTDNPPTGSTNFSSESNHNRNVDTTESNLNVEMGIQSQKRGGAIKNCRKAATARKSKHRLKQGAIGGGLAFDPDRDCNQCVAIAKWKSGLRSGAPHRPHDKRCPHNRKTRGMSERTVFVLKEAERNIRLNNTPIAQGNDGVYRNPVDAAVWNRFFQPRADVSVQTTNKDTSSAIDNNAALSTVKIGSKSNNNYADPTNIRKVIDEQILAFENGDSNNWLNDFKYSKATGVLVDYIYNLVAHHKAKSTSSPLPSSNVMAKALDNYATFFPHGNLKFQVPPEPILGIRSQEKPPPSPYYESIVGLTLLYVDWRLVVDYPLLCFNCFQNKTESVLNHERTNWSRNRSLFPIFDGTGASTLCILMHYKCETCGLSVAANDGRLLMLLPAHVRSTYPVAPRFARGTFHLSKDASTNLEHLMRTYANAKFVSSLWYRKLGEQFEGKVETYLSKNPTLPFVTFSEFRKGSLPPSPRSLRSLFLEAEKSPLTPYGYSFMARYAREIQSVSVKIGETISIDWTFQTLKNYTNLPGAKAIFTAMTGKTREVLTLGIVASTSVNEVAHMLTEMIQKRKVFSPSILYTDTCPNNTNFWQQLFGESLVHRLGLFHLVHRIVDTLDNRSGLFWEALVKLKAAVYRYFEHDERSLLASLKDGTFSKDSKRYTDAEIDAIRHSKRWRERFDPFLRKQILAGTDIKSNLQRWIVDYCDATDANSRPIFTTTTKKTALEQLNKVDYVSDPPNIELYQKIPAGKNSHHQLSKWRSIRAESALEKFHEQLAHFANTGTGPELADALTLGGAARRNVEARWKTFANDQRLKGQDLAIPTHFEDVPPFSDHSMLALLNKQALKQNLPAVFEFCTPIFEDNGEVFLSKYFLQQDARKKTTGSDKNTQMCKCDSCITYCHRDAFVANETAREASGTECESGDKKNDVSDDDSEKRQEHHKKNDLAPATNTTIHNNTSVMTPYGLFFNRVDCCYPFPPFRCPRFQRICEMKEKGLKLPGRKPNLSNPDHDSGCPRAHFIG